MAQQSMLQPITPGDQRTPQAICRNCDAPLTHTFVDLGMSPPCELLVTADRLDEMEAFYPLHVYVCDHCWLVQLREYISPEEIFTEYAYFSSYSDAWLRHASDYVDAITQRLQLGPDSLVVELASNDGYLLQYFQPKGIEVLGIEPAANVAKAAIERGVPTIVEFFGADVGGRLRDEGKQADLIVANNVVAHVPDLHSFIEGAARLLKPDGVFTFEVQHLLRMMEGNQFDTIYHEHFCYLSLLAVEDVFSRRGLVVYDIDRLWTHGGSLRYYVRHSDRDGVPECASVQEVRDEERSAGLTDLATYARFTEQVHTTKRDLLRFLIDAKAQGKSIAGYGAPGKGNTLLNYCGIRQDYLDYTVDRNTYKHGKFLPGTHIPVHDPSTIEQTKPDYVLILPWNLRDEIVEQLSYIREWGAKFVIPIPRLEVL